MLCTQEPHFVIFQVLGTALYKFEKIVILISPIAAAWEATGFKFLVCFYNCEGLASSAIVRKINILTDSLVSRTDLKL